MHFPPNRTLVIRLSSVGDIVLSSLLLRTLRRNFPECRIDYLVKEEFSDLVRYNPHVTSVLEFPGGFGKLTALRQQVATTGYDLVLDLHGSLRSHVLCAGRRNVRRINKRKIARFFLVRAGWNMYSVFGGAPSVAERYLKTVSHLGVKNDGEGLDLFFPDSARDAAAVLLKEARIPTERPCIGIAPSAKHATKIWIGERFAEAAAVLAVERSAPVILFGSTDDRQKCEEVAARISEKSPHIQLLNSTGRTSLLEAAALMDHCSLFITNDSGLMHIAAARKRNVLALFGSTVQEFGFSPYGTRHIVVENNEVPCRPCTHIGRASCPRGHFRCMTDIETARVVQAGRHLLNS